MSQNHYYNSQRPLSPYKKISNGMFRYDFDGRKVFVFKVRFDKWSNKIWWATIDGELTGIDYNSQREAANDALGLIFLMMEEDRETREIELRRNPKAKAITNTNKAITEERNARRYKSARLGESAA